MTEAAPGDVDGGPPQATLMTEATPGGLFQSPLVEPVQLTHTLMTEAAPGGLFRSPPVKPVRLTHTLVTESAPGDCS